MVGRSEGLSRCGDRMNVMVLVALGGGSGCSAVLR